MILEGRVERERQRGEKGGERNWEGESERQGGKGEGERETEREKVWALPRHP